MYAISTRKRLLALSAIVAISTAFSACKDNDDSYNKPALEIGTELSNNSLALDANGTAQTITFTANRKWTASSNASWLDVSPASGEAGTYTITLKALANAGLERTGVVGIKFGSSSQSFNVLQAGSGVVSSQYAGMPLADFVRKYDTGSPVTISEDESFQAVVISDKDGGNIALKNLNVQATDAGIAVRLKDNNTFPVGTLITIKAKGATVQRFQNGPLQIDLTNGGEATDAGEVRTIEPTVATLADIYAGKYENMLVAIDGLQFVKANEALYTGTTATSFSEVSDCVTEPTNTRPLSLGVSRFATFKDSQKSDKRGRIVGIISHSANASSKFVNIFPRTLADIQLTEERCTASTTGNTGGTNNGGGTNNNGGGSNGGGGGTQTPPSTTDAHPIITVYLEGKANNKFIQIYNPTQQTIDLQEYSLQMQNFTNANALASGSNNGINELKLTGTLAPQAVLVVKHTGADADAFTGTAIIGGSFTNFNGNDNVALVFKGTMIDVVGTWGAAWLSDGKPAGADVILKRKASIVKGATTYNVDEWESSTDVATKPYSFLSSRP